MRCFHVTGTSLAIPALVVLSACTPTDEGTRARTRETPREATADVAHVRYVNGLTANVGAELYFADARLFGGDKRDETAYVEVPAGRHDFELRHAGTGLAKTSEGLRRDAHFTVIAFDEENGKATLRVVNDEEAAPSSGNAKVRLIDAAGRTGDFDSYFAGRKDRLTGEPVIGDVSRWKEVNAVQEPLEIRVRGDKTKRIALPGVRLQAGTLYTVVVIDGQTADQPLAVTTLQNEPTKLPLPAPPVMPVS